MDVLFFLPAKGAPHADTVLFTVDTVTKKWTSTGIISF